MEPDQNADSQEKKRRDPDPLPIGNREAMKAFFMNRKYRAVVPLRNGSGFAIRNQLLVHIEALEIWKQQENGRDPVPSMLEKPEEIARYLAQKHIITDNYGRTYEVTLSSECTCGNTSVYVLEGEGIEQIEEIMVMKGKDPPPATSNPIPPIRSSANTILFAVPDGGKLVNANQFDPGVFKGSYEDRKKNPNHLTVAVLDSGIDSPLEKNFPFWFKNAPDPCKNPQAYDQIGWNFTAKVNTPADSYPLDDTAISHGTKVARIIDKIAPDNTSLMMVKVLDENGIGTLLNVLCGLAYAKENKADIINTSFGYYGPEIPILRKALEQLNEAGILVVAAAGNHTDFDGYPNNISINRFYPAAFSLELGNVVTVTTVKCEREKPSICCNVPLKTCRMVPVENYSPEFVNIGILTQDGTFDNPIEPDQGESRIDGSSYAAPTLVGLIARKFHLIKPTLTNGTAHSIKSKYFAALPLEEDSTLKDYVRGGKYIKIP